MPVYRREAAVSSPFSTLYIDVGALGRVGLSRVMLGGGSSLLRTIQSTLLHWFEQRAFAQAQSAATARFLHRFKSVYYKLIRVRAFLHSSVITIAHHITFTRFQVWFSNHTKGVVLLRMFYVH